MTTKLLAVLLFGTVLVTPSPAQEPETDGPGVARLSVMNGDVSVRRGDSGDWVAAATNAPIVVSDAVFSGRASRAEVQLDSSNMVRLASETEVRFSELEYRRFQVQVARGTVMLSVLRDNEAEIDLNTPNISIRPLERGRYRVTVQDDGTTEVTVRTGQAEVFSPTGVEVLTAGKTMIVRGTAADPEFQLAATIPKDSWDRWNEQRDKELRRGYEGYKYASRDIAGVEDLHDYGSWVYVPPYGWVWSPRVAAGWAPYRYGRWSWVDYYGWSWVSYDPWGWAPYHYGRWFYRAHYGWCWYPGAYRARHYWSPGLVAFFGWGSHSGFRFGVGVGFGFGHVGWVPLAPYERYHPWYGRRYYRGYRNKTYIDNSVNIVNNINIKNVYRNARVNNAITAVDGNSFGRRQVRNVFNRDSHNLRQANLVRGQVPVVPQRASLNYSDRQARSVGTRGRTGRQSFAARRTARQVDRVPFAQQQRGVERSARAVFDRQSQRSASSGRSASPSSLGAGQSRTRVTNAQQPARPSTRSATSSTASGWRRFGEPSAARQSGRSSTAGTGSAARSARPSTSGSQTGGGWRRFGEPVQTPSSSAARSAQRSGRSASGSRASRPAASGSSTRGSSGSSSWRSFGSRGSASRPSSTTGRSSGASRSGGGSLGIRPPVVRERSSGSRSSGGSRAYNPPSRSSRSSGSRTYSPPSRSSRPSGSRTYSPPSRSSRPSSGRTYSPPSRSSRPSSGRTYSPPSRPSRSSAPSRTYSPPSRSSGGSRSGSMGGGASRGSSRGSSGRGGRGR